MYNPIFPIAFVMMTVLGKGSRADLTSFILFFYYLKQMTRYLSAGAQTWRYLRPNCTATAPHVLRQGGVVVPAWSISPGLHLGVKVGSEVTFMAGTVGTMAPDLLHEVHFGGH